MPFVDVPGYGRFDPAIPDWLELRGGKLYNKNAADKSQPWVPPADFRGGSGLTFTPESAAPAPVQPAPPVAPDPRAVAVREFSDAVKAFGAYQSSVLDAYLAESQRQFDASKALVAALRPIIEKFDAALKVAVGGA